MFVVIRQYSYTLQDDFAGIEAIITQLPDPAPVMFKGLRPVWVGEFVITLHDSAREWEVPMPSLKDVWLDVLGPVSLRLKMS